MHLDRSAFASRLWASVVAVVLASGCGGESADGGGGSSPSACVAPAQELTGATYSLERSRFAFGSPPVEQSEGGVTRWVGAQGAVVVGRFGDALGVMNAGAPASKLPDWSSDPEALTTHAREYLLSMGVAPCQVQSTQILAGSGGRIIHLNRGFEGIPVIASNAYARLNSEDQSTVEGLFWPAIPADVVAAALSLRDRLADPAALADYQQKLPAEARGPGQVVVQHSSMGLLPGAAFRAAAAWSTLAGRSPLSFDADGARVDVD